MGVLEVTVRDANGEPVSDVYGQLEMPDGLLHRGFAIEAGRGVSGTVPAGEHALHLLGDGVLQSAGRVRIRPGETTSVEIELVAGSMRSFEFEHPDDGFDLRLQIQWCDASGEVLCTSRVQWPQAPEWITEQCFAPGRYRVRAESHAGLRADVAFEVGPGPELAPVSVRLR